MHSNWEEKSINLFIKGTQHKIEIVVDANIIISSLIATKDKTFDCLFCE
jgi:predicted nucleic acid-binding protein